MRLLLYEFLIHAIMRFCKVSLPQLSPKENQIINLQECYFMFNLENI